MWQINRQNIFFKRVLLSKAAIGVLSLLFLTLFLGGISPTRAQQTNGDGDVFPVPETYKTEGIPPIKKSEVENLFYDPASIRSNLIWDADGKNRRLLVTDEKNTVYLLNSPLGASVELFDKRVPNSLKVRPAASGGENGFAFTDDHEDEDNYQLYLYGFKDKTIKKVTTLTGKDESIESFVWDKTGKFLHYTRVDYETKTSRLCQNDLSAEKCFPAELKGIWSVLDADGDKTLLKHWKASSSQLLYVYDRAANKLAPVDEKGNSRKAALFGETVFWLTEGNDACEIKAACVLSLNLKKGTAQKLNLPENLSDFNDVKFSPTGVKMLVQETRDGVDLLRVFRLRNGKVAKEFPSFVSGSYVIWNTRWMTDEEVVFTLENNGKPASVHSFNLETKKFTEWTKERLPAQLEGKVKPPEIIRWQSFDNREISGYVVRPAAVVQGKSPVLIFLHGGPQVLDKPVFNTGDIRLAANLGLTIIHTNIRGSSGFGKEFMDADNAGKRGDAVKDVQALLDWIGKQPGLDANKIYLRGQSYGGFVALSTALQEPSRIKGVIAEYPLVSIRGYLAQSWIDEVARSEYGDPKDEQLMKRLDALTPLNNTDRWNQIPLFITRGKLDARVPEKEVIDLKNQLQNKNSEVWFVYATDGGHSFGGQYVTAAMYQFLKKQINKEN